MSAWRRIGLKLGALSAGVVFAVALWPGPARAQGPQQPYPVSKDSLRNLPRLGTALPAAQASEAEPNNTPADANLVAIGDTVSGLIGPAGDVDFFGLDVPANTGLSVDVDASQYGSSLDPILYLYDTDGVTLLAWNDDFDGLDSRIKFFIVNAGRYFLKIVDFGTPDGGSQYYYSLNVATLQLGPGDPPTLFASGFDINHPRAMVADGAGNLMVVDDGENVLRRVSPTGTVGTFVRLPGYDPRDIVIDGFGDFLVAGGYSNAVWRVKPTGQVSRFLSFSYPSYYPQAVAVGPNGDVWVFSSYNYYLSQYDPIGRLKRTIYTGVSVSDLKFSPSGVLHFSDGSGTVYKLPDSLSSKQAVISANPYLEGLAFDRDGFLYVANGYRGEVALYDTLYAVAASPFARFNLGGPIDLVFGREATGAPNSRLFASNGGFGLSRPWAGGVVEMNPTGVRATGFQFDITCQLDSLWGDLDGDLAVNSRDALIALSAAVGLPTAGFAVSLGDVDDDKQVTSRDALFTLSYGLATEQYYGAAYTRIGNPAAGSCAPAASPAVARTATRGRSP